MEEPSSIKNTQKIRTVFIAILFLIVGVAGGYFFRNMAENRMPQAGLDILKELQDDGTLKTALNDRVTNTGYKKVTYSASSDVPYTFSVPRASGWSTYHNDEYGFEIMYPSYMRVLSKKENVGFVSLCSESDTVCLSYEKDKGVYHGFEGAVVAVSVSDTNTTQTSCEQETMDVYQGPEATWNVQRYGGSTINGIVFFSHPGYGEGATGHTAHSQEYSKFYNGRCYTVRKGSASYRCDGSYTKDETTGISYCGDDNKPFINDDKLTTDLNSIIATFKFTK